LAKLNVGRVTQVIVTVDYTINSQNSKVSGPESKGSDGMKAQGYKAQKVMADSRPQPRGLNIDCTLGRRTGSVGVSPGYVSGRPHWAGNTRSQPGLRFPIICEPIIAVAVPKCSVCTLPTRHVRHPVTVAKLLSVWVSLH